MSEERARSLDNIKKETNNNSEDNINPCVHMAEFRLTPVDISILLAGTTELRTNVFDVRLFALFAPISEQHFS